MPDSSPMVHPHMLSTSTKFSLPWLCWSLMGHANPDLPHFWACRLFSNQLRPTFCDSHPPSPRKFLCKFLICLIIDFGVARTENMYKGVTCSTNFTKISLLEKFRVQKVHRVSFCLILSRRSFHETCLMVDSASGAPKYLEGSLPSKKPKILKISLLVASVASYM